MPKCSSGLAWADQASITAAIMAVVMDPDMATDRAMDMAMAGVTATTIAGGKQCAATTTGFKCDAAAEFGKEVEGREFISPFSLVARLSLSDANVCRHFYIAFNGMRIWANIMAAFGQFFSVSLGQAGH